MPFCFIELSLKRKIISLDNVNRLVPFIRTQCLFCVLETEILKHCVEKLGTAESSETEETKDISRWVAYFLET
jgi:hypothetical protein